jgi:hypothetical protein
MENLKDQKRQLLEDLGIIHYYITSLAEWDIVNPDISLERFEEKLNEAIAEFKEGNPDFNPYKKWNPGSWQRYSDGREYVKECKYQQHP